MEELRHGTRIHNPHFLPNNTYGNQPPVEIKQNLEAQESPCPTNEDDDLGTMYSIVQISGERLLHPLLQSSMFPNNVRIFSNFLTPSKGYEELQ